MLRLMGLIIYFIVLLADILLIAIGKENYRFCTKPLLMILLAVYVLYANVKMPVTFRAFLLLALFFSSFGDDLLLFDSLFLPGLGSFFIAHIMYSIFFLKIRYSNLPVPNCRYVYIFLNAAAVIAFIMFLLPYLGSLAMPVILYAIVISIMLQSAIHAFHFERQPAGWYCVIGALLFIISDGLIATGKFYHPLPGGDILVMLTYGFAQWALVVGSTAYFRVKISR
ncbi:lysoplasmalogenase [Chitinophaga arvensicola]|uniref:Uncharacterized membrane protein YhhN n=1 Tax=Chitinophaga arvensicola TaxID=29529 RepID=A0A1I0NWV8_9BACT|nr:lysoplasmalogenase [Chitinophaga arvensicola]SEW06332.1 Uncharacterized membrane protein YhhN [Chitinophaga arvensicola]